MLITYARRRLESPPAEGDGLRLIDLLRIPRRSHKPNQSFAPNSMPQVTGALHEAPMPNPLYWTWVR